jgi:hypothetical protein
MATGSPRCKQIPLNLLARRDLRSVGRASLDRVDRTKTKKQDDQLPLDC